MFEGEVSRELGLFESNHTSTYLSRDLPYTQLCLGAVGAASM